MITFSCSRHEESRLQAWTYSVEQISSTLSEQQESDLINQKGIDQVNFSSSEGTTAFRRAIFSESSGNMSAENHKEAIKTQQAAIQFKLDSRCSYNTTGEPIFYGFMHDFDGSGTTEVMKEYKC
jgi:archaellin